MRKSQLEIDLEDWAKWLESLNSFPGSNTLGRAMSGQLESGVFGSTLPKGVDAPTPTLQRICLAMGNCLAVPRKARYITAMQLHYLLGPEGVEERLGKPSRTIRRWRRRGEDILRRELKAL